MTDSATTATNPELAVRNYLTFLSDPSQLVDAALVQDLQNNVDAARDPIDKLRAIAAVERAKAADPDAFRAEFIANAKQCAQTEGVPAAAFRTMGVPADVLAAAGLDAGPRRRRGGKAKAQPSSGTRTRRPSVKADQLDEGILGMAGEFTIKDVVDRIGGSQLTVRAALDRLEAQGKVTATGQRSGGRGRAAKTWKAA
jgi:DNA-binding transcriptional ArsR family regulator